MAGPRSRDNDLHHWITDRARDGWTLTRIAAHTGKHPRTIRRILTQHGVPPRPRPSPPAPAARTVFPVPLDCGHEQTYPRPAPKPGQPAWCLRCDTMRHAAPPPGRSLQ